MGLVLSNPSTGGSGSDNIVRVADIAARDALTPDSEVIVRVQDASSDPNVDSGIAWYQWDGSSSYELIEKGESSKLTSAELAALISSLALEFVGGASYSPADPDELEFDYPAASNSGKWGIVNGGTAFDGLYRSNGSYWTKLLDDSGNRADLFSYVGGVVYSGVNAISTNSGTPKQELGGVVSSTSSAPFNGDTSGYTTYGGSNRTIFKWFDNPLKLGKFTLVTRVIVGTRQFSIVGVSGTIDAPTYTNLTPISVTGSLSISGDYVNNLVSDSTVTIETNNNSMFNGYGIFMSGSYTFFEVRDFKGETFADNTTFIDCVSAINNLNGRLVSAEADIITTDAAATAASAAATAAMAAISSGEAGGVEFFVKDAATGDGSGGDASNYMAWGDFEDLFAQIYTSTFTTSKTKKIIVHIPTGETIAVSTKNCFCDYDISFVMAGDVTFTTNSLNFYNCRLRFNKASSIIYGTSLGFFECQVSTLGGFNASGTMSVHNSDIRAVSPTTAGTLYMDNGKIIGGNVTVTNTLTMYNNSLVIASDTVLCDVLYVDEFSKLKSIYLNIATSGAATTGGIIIYSSAVSVVPTAGDSSASVVDL